MKKIAAEKVDLLLHVPYYTHFQIFFLSSNTHFIVQNVYGKKRNWKFSLKGRRLQQTASEGQSRHQAGEFISKPKNELITFKNSLVRKHKLRKFSIIWDLWAQVKFQDLKKNNNNNNNF